LIATLGPDRPKRSQDGPKRTSKRFKEQKTCICKNLETPFVFLGFWGPRPFKTAYEEPRRLPRGYFGLLGAILNLLGTILETRVF